MKIPLTPQWIDLERGPNLDCVLIIEMAIRRQAGTAVWAAKRFVEVRRRGPK